MRNWVKAGSIATIFYLVFAMLDANAGAKLWEIFTNVIPASIVLFLLIMLDLQMAYEWDKKQSKRQSDNNV
jgi:hypothetical protein